jgi:hypothetical protein
MARSHRRLATIAATGALAGFAALAAAGSASAATTPAHPAPSGAPASGTVCVVSAVDAPAAVQSGVCTVVVVHEGVLTQLLNDLL